tara:strand:- start:66 stop:581 length:516 start_codon:yes stop_codon:yes gene_type:complete
MTTLQGPSGKRIIDALKKSSVKYVAALPDITTSSGLLWPLAEEPDLELIRLSKEDEGVSICAALGYCEKRAVLLMQQTGLTDSLNNIRAIGCDYKQPICMLVGLLGKEPDKLPTESESFGVRIIQPILEVMKIDHILIQTPDDVELLSPAIDRAYELSRPLVAMIGRTVAT